jgi:hypothetical protein
MVNNSTKINQTMNHLSPLTSAQWTYKITSTYDVGNPGPMIWRKFFFFVLSIGRQHCSTISCKDYKWFQLTSIKSFQRQYFPTYLLFCNRCASWGTNKTHNTPLEHDLWRMKHIMHVKTTFIISYKQLCMQWVLVTRPESMTTWPYAFYPPWSCDTLNLPLTVPPY